MTSNYCALLVFAILLIKRIPILKIGELVVSFGSVVDQEKDVSRFFRQDESRCCVADSSVPSKNKGTSFSSSTTDPFFLQRKGDYNLMVS